MKRLSCLLPFISAEASKELSYTSGVPPPPPTSTFCRFIFTRLRVSQSRFLHLSGMGKKRPMRPPNHWREKNDCTTIHWDERKRPHWEKSFLHKRNKLVHCQRKKRIVLGKNGKRELIEHSKAGEKRLGLVTPGTGRMGGKMHTHTPSCNCASHKHRILNSLWFLTFGRFRRCSAAVHIRTFLRKLLQMQSGSIDYVTILGLVDKNVYF